MMIGVVTGICLLNSGHSPADLVDTGDPAEHLRQIGKMVYQLYQLTAEEINMVEGQ